MLRSKCGSMIQLQVLTRILLLLMLTEYWKIGVCLKRFRCWGLSPQQLVVWLRQGLCRCASSCHHGDGVTRARCQRRGAGVCSLRRDSPEIRDGVVHGALICESFVSVCASQVLLDLAFTIRSGGEDQ